MKFVHIADMHFDGIFNNISNKENSGELRRLDQRKIFKKIIDYIKENEIKYFFISGDLYEHKYIRKSTIEYINNLFSEIPNTQIFISPGNHDPFITNSYYNKFIWNDNVKIFNSKIEKIQTEDANIYGYGFNDFYCTNSGINNLELDDKTKLNILVIHGTLDGANIEDQQYNSLNSKLLKEKGFDYIALGHIHKLDYNSYEHQNIVYPGSTIAQGFDELGEHGMIVGTLEKNSLELNFVPLDDKQFEINKLDISEINSKEELIEKLNDLNYNPNHFIEIYLIGTRNFEINTNEILKLISNNQILKIKDITSLNYDFEKLSRENNLKGIFIKKMLEKIGTAQNDLEKLELEKALEIGFDSLK